MTAPHTKTEVLETRKKKKTDLLATRTASYACARSSPFSFTAGSLETSRFSISWFCHTMR